MVNPSLVVQSKGRDSRRLRKVGSFKEGHNGVFDKEGKDLVPVGVYKRAFPKRLFDIGKRATC